VAFAEQPNGATRDQLVSPMSGMTPSPSWTGQNPQARIINLETSATTSQEDAPKGRNYKMNPANIGCFGAASMDCCGLANNHVLDFGRSGLLETIRL
jgi:poly-gamma-glutamate capsule biosynthesis protein CapA/YwtB (metallophosphatase superfamily)